MAAERPVVVALGPVDPALVAGVLGDGVSFVAEPNAADLAVAVGAIARADAVVDAELFDRAPRLRVVARTGVGVDLVDLEAAKARGITVVITPGSGTRAVAEGVLALALHLVKRLGPLTAQTRHLVDEAFLARVRPEAVLVNCGRGGLLDLDATLAALRAGRLAGVGLDVFDPEPPPHHPLFDHPDVVLTPHLMGLTRRATAATFADAARGITDVLAGRRPAAVAT